MWSVATFGQSATDVDCQGCVDSSDIAGSAIRSAHIKNESIKNSDIALDNLSGIHFKDGTIENSDIALQTIDSSNLGPDVHESFDSLDQRLNQLTGPGIAARQVLTAIPLASEIRYLFAEHLLLTGEPPVDNSAATAPQPMDIRNDFISEVAIENGNIVTTFGGNADLSIQQSTLEFVPSIEGDNVIFDCNPTGGVITVFDSDDCSFIDEPPQPITAIRNQVASAILLASEVRWTVQDYYGYFGVWPDNYATAGTEPPMLFFNQFIQSVSTLR